MVFDRFTLCSLVHLRLRTTHPQKHEKCSYQLFHTGHLPFLRDVLRLQCQWWVKLLMSSSDQVIKGLTGTGFIVIMKSYDTVLRKQFSFSTGQFVSAWYAEDETILTATNQLEYTGARIFST